MNERLPQWALAPSSYDYIAVLLMVLSAAGDLKRIEVLLNKVEEEQHRRTIEPLAARERHAAAGRGPVVEFLRAFIFFRFFFSLFDNNNFIFNIFYFDTHYTLYICVCVYVYMFSSFLSFSSFAKGHHMVRHV